MDATHFDRLTRSLTDSPSRRGLLGGLAAAAVGLATLRLAGGAEARKKRKKRKNKAQPPAFNQFGCLNVGQKCRGKSANCCSGICQGKKPKKGKQDTSRCMAHNAGECQADEDACGGIQAACGIDGICGRTTGKASFCGKQGQCAVCTKDADCEADFGPGAACTVCSECVETGTTACAAAAA